MAKRNDYFHHHPICPRLPRYGVKSPSPQNISGLVSFFDFLASLALCLSNILLAVHRNICHGSLSSLVCQGPTPFSGCALEYHFSSLSATEFTSHFHRYDCFSVCHWYFSTLTTHCMGFSSSLPVGRFTVSMLQLTVNAGAVPRSVRGRLRMACRLFHLNSKFHSEAPKPYTSRSLCHIIDQATKAQKNGRVPLLRNSALQYPWWRFMPLAF